ncbi:MAG: DUF4846 domain-containing protein [candidate division Zixibacteria bacterium]
MTKPNFRLLPLLLILIFPASSLAQYSWLDSFDSANSVTSRIPPPDGYKRVKVEAESFRHWLRNLPLKSGDPPIYLYNGEKKFNQLANYAVIDIDIGTGDLQQCADAVIRLQSEYFYSKGHYDSIAFNFTSGDRFRYTDWLNGKTPVIDGNDVGWKDLPKRENNRANFKKYLEIVFTYAGSYSLSKELIKVEKISEMRIGDIFIEGGFPGHAMLVVDMAENTESGKRVFLLAQSYMPAQSIHIVKNPVNWGLSPWYKTDFGDRLYTLEWVFDNDDLMRFK